MLKMQTAPDETAAIIIEPILGEGGFLTPPPRFLQGVRKLCDENHILMIVDEARSPRPRCAGSIYISCAIAPRPCAAQRPRCTVYLSCSPSPSPVHPCFGRVCPRSRQRK
jgi:Aminotransferase class-III